MDVALLAEELHDQSWVESPVKPIGRSFAVRYLSKLDGVDRVAFLKYCLASFDRSYSVNLLLSLPELWQPLRLGEWSAIMLGLSPRPEFSPHDPTGRYSDVIFFVKWLDLDALGFTFSIPGIPAADKLRVARYCEAKAGSLVVSPEDLDDLDGEVLCSRDHLVAYRAKLLSEDGRLRPPYAGEDALREYAGHLAGSVAEGGQPTRQGRRGPTT